MIDNIKIKEIIDRYLVLQTTLSEAAGSEDYARLSKEFSDLSPLAKIANYINKLNNEIKDLSDIINDVSSDSEVVNLANEEIKILNEKIIKEKKQLKILLLPKNKDDERNAILEVRAGTGGDEAGMFAADLFRMYQRYAETKQWKFEIMSISENNLGGVKEASATIVGQNVFSKLKFESGVHRVQRVPVTESSGRIHTSAATIAVLPEAEEVDVKIEDKEIRVDVYRASGPGGQSVNTTDSAVRITHLPSGIVVTQQDEKSQHKNRSKALKILRARLFDLERQRAESERADKRRSQIGSGDRSERIRTYNFPQNRITDHRINLTVHKLDKVLAGESLDEIIDVLNTVNQEELIGNEK